MDFCCAEPRAQSNSGLDCQICVHNLELGIEVIADCKSPHVFARATKRGQPLAHGVHNIVKAPFAIEAHWAFVECLCRMHHIRILTFGLFPSNPLTRAFGKHPFIDMDNFSPSKHPCIRIWDHYEVFKHSTLHLSPSTCSATCAKATLSKRWQSHLQNTCISKFH